jgi:hypothetical protein
MRKRFLLIGIALIVIVSVFIYAATTSSMTSEYIIQEQGHIGMSDISFPQISISGSCKFTIKQTDFEKGEWDATIEKSI